MYKHQYNNQLENNRKVKEVFFLPFPTIERNGRVGASTLLLFVNQFEFGIGQCQPVSWSEQSNPASCLALFISCYVVVLSISYIIIPSILEFCAYCAWISHWLLGMLCILNIDSGFSFFLIKKNLSCYLKIEGPSSFCTLYLMYGLFWHQF